MAVLLAALLGASLLIALRRGPASAFDARSFSARTTAAAPSLAPRPAALVAHAPEAPPASSFALPSASRPTTASPSAPVAGHENCCGTFAPSAASALGFALASGDYVRAAALVADLPAGPSRDRAQLHLADLWAARDPAAAARYADSFSVGEKRWAALASVLLRWRERDVAAAGDWLNSIPRTLDHDAAVAAIANYPPLMQDDPALAVTWAWRVTAPTLRWDTLRSAIRHWAFRDEPAARRYIADTPLFTPAQRDQLLARLGDRTAVLD